MRIRLWHAGSRLIIMTGRTRGESADREHWLSVHLAAPPWDEIFRRGFDQLDLDAVADRGVRRTPDGSIAVRWTAARYWTRIDLRFERGSPRKRELMATALLKTARYLLLTSRQRT